MSARFTTTPGGFPLVHESNFSLPLVDFAIIWRAGSLGDAAGAEGGARLLARLLRRGTRALKADAVDERIALLGGRMSVSASREALRVQCTVLERNLEPFLELVASLVVEPALRDADFRRAKRRIVAEIEDAEDDDSTIASNHLRNHLFGEHPYGRAIGGTKASLRRITRSSLVEAHQKKLVRSQLLFAVAGATKTKTFSALIDRYFGGLPKGRSSGFRVPATKAVAGRRVRIIHRPGRSQTQLAIACLSAKRSDPQLAELVLGDCVFGGLYSSRLMQAVRGDKGWSYGAYTSLRVSAQRDAWSLWTHPAAENAAACAALELDLIDQYLDEGPSAAEVRLAKSYLIGSRCLEEDTAAKRVELALDAVFVGRDPNFPRGFPKRVRAVKRANITDVIRRRFSADALSIIAVGDAEVLRPQFEALPGVSEVDVARIRL
ncbi:MAG: zinc protease [Polyangiales bacterium]|jgi:zinc protease